MSQNETQSPNPSNKTLTPKVSPKKSTSLNVYDKTTLKRILKHLSKQRRERKDSQPVASCPVEDTSESKIDHQVKLRCRQLPNVVKVLRRAIMRQDWSYVATLTMILCHPGLKYYTTIILRVCFILLLNHPKSNLNLLQNFIRLTTDYILEEDVNKFIKILFALRKKRLAPLGSGKYIRKTGDYKVVKDPEFECL